MIFLTRSRASTRSSSVITDRQLETALAAASRVALQ
jgi:hypothetical protein